MRRTAALVRLEKKLAKDPCAILSAAEIRILDREVRRALVSSFPGIESHLARSEDTTRWHALGRDVARPAVHAGFVMCRLRLASLNTDCGQSKTVS